MYDIRQFKPAMYILIVLGISGFALAAKLPGIWAIAIGFILLNAWLVKIRRFRPMSRIIANTITILSVLYVVRELVTSPTTPVLVIGEFLVFLQIVKIWELRANRDFAQLLVLSLLLMVAASMNTASLVFAVLLVAYLFLSLYCCLLFHLKVETDAARAAMPVPEDKISPGTLRQDQRKLSRSMRRLTALVSTVSIGSSVLVFLLFPRGSGAGFLGPMQPFRNSTALTGFSDTVSFQDVAKITQNHETVAFVKVWKGDQLVAGTETLFLRGLTFDKYHKPDSPGGSWDWGKTDAANPITSSARQTEPWVALQGPDGAWRQQIALLPTHTSVLFGLAGPVRFTPRQPMKIRYSEEDGTLETLAPLTERIDYELVSRNEPGRTPPRSREQVSNAPDVAAEFPDVLAFALKPEVSGADERGSLVEQRRQWASQPGNFGVPSTYDARIAANLEQYFRTHFSYTLDLTDETSVHGRNPLEAFLFDWKRGHCEYFAGAMTLMCQALGLESRMVIGFKVAGDDYNSLTETYTVHDSDAHAWVEVNTPEGWKGFDPTSSREATSPSAGMLARARHLMEYLEYTYANAVIAYDRQNRESVIARIETGLAGAATWCTDRLNDVHEFIRNSFAFWNASSWALMGLLFLISAGVAAAMGRYLWERGYLLRRAHRIGIRALPESEQMRLARQLGFYDDMLRLLDQYQIRRAAHHTPLEFCRSLAFLPSEAYDTVHRLTQLFYKVRYGGTELPPARQRRLDNVIGRLEAELARAAGQLNPSPHPQMPVRSGSAEPV
ncbi:MAG TPA: DUF3488 and transglutaminase-like domain-containing protein [Tepidisphaeraceae bacterium]|nr:DUF3488 and transglutaminase-like domain-containing protein [Tepidisphaeraceae bacterium]